MTKTPTPQPAPAPTPAPNVRRYSKEALARFVEEAFWPVAAAAERLELIELDLQIEKVQAELTAQLTKLETIAASVSAAKEPAAQLLKVKEHAAESKRFGAAAAVLTELRKKRFPA